MLSLSMENHSHVYEYYKTFFFRPTFPTFPGRREWREKMIRKKVKPPEFDPDYRMRDKSFLRRTVQDFKTRTSREPSNDGKSNMWIQLESELQIEAIDIQFLLLKCKIASDGNLLFMVTNDLKIGQFNVKFCLRNTIQCDRLNFDLQCPNYMWHVFLPTCCW